MGLDMSMDRRRRPEMVLEHETLVAADFGDRLNGSLHGVQGSRYWRPPGRRNLGFREGKNVPSGNSESVSSATSGRNVFSRFKCEDLSCEP